MPPVLIRDRLLREAVARHELSLKACVAVQDLLRHHVSFEQALVGTRLITAERFSEWMQIASGLPLMPVVDGLTKFPPGIERETALGWGIVPQRVSEGSWLIGLSDPWDREVRATIESLAVEQGWKVQWALVLPSAMHRWQKMPEANHQKRSQLTRMAREFVQQAERGQVVTIAANSELVHPMKPVRTVLPAWIPALRLRLARRANEAGLQLQEEQHPRSSLLTLSRQVSEPLVRSESEHPVLDWSDTLAQVLNQNVLVFVFDSDESIMPSLEKTHVPYTSTDWRAGQRWLSTPENALQEELLHYAMAGYAGTVRFRSLPTLAEWERVAHAMGVAHTVCKGIPTNHGTAWSIYSV